MPNGGYSTRLPNYLEHTAELRIQDPLIDSESRTIVWNRTYWGWRSQLERHFTVGQWAHSILFGLDGSQTEAKRPYDRSETDLLTGEIPRQLRVSPTP